MDIFPTALGRRLGWEILKNVLPEASPVQCKTAVTPRAALAPAAHTARDERVLTKSTPGTY